MKKYLVALFLLLLISIDSFGQEKYLDYKITTLKELLKSLPKANHDKFLTSYDVEYDSDSSIISFIETRHSPDGKHADLKKGYYKIMLNDLDIEKIEVKNDPIKGFELFIPCKYDLGKSKLVITDGNSIYGVNYGSYVKMGCWKGENSKIKCDEIVTLLKEIISKAPPKSLTLKSFDVDSLQFPIFKKSYFVFNNESQEYDLDYESNEVGVLLYKNSLIKVIYTNKENEMYRIGSAKNATESDRIVFDVNNDDVFAIAFSPDRDNVTFLAVNFKIIYELNPTQK